MSQWADRERKLSPESSAEPGQWNTDRAPYQRGIMDAVNDPLIDTVVVMKSAQVGWTEILGNVVGYFVDNDPCPILLIQPTLEMGEAWSKDRLAPMVRDTFALRSKIKDAKSRDSGNTLLHKTFPGGHITIAGANSPAGLASRPIRVVLFDEVDRYPPSAGAEGDPVSLASKRTTTFWNRKKLMGSTPTIKGLSRIEAAYDGSDQRRYHVPCPHCNEPQALKWSQVHWPEGKPSEAYYVCEHCGSVITDQDKPEMLRLGEWVGSKPHNGVAGFHINELYSPWVTFGEMATNFVEAKKLPETLKTWVNTALAETWEEKGETVDETGLLSRRESYGPEIPSQAAVLTAGIDVQADRLECETVAWGPGEESWSVEYQIFTGDPAKPEVWQALDDYLLSPFDHESGAKLKIAAACIDSGGHHTKQVYAFTSRRFARRVYATKGIAGQGKPLVKRPDRNSKAKGRIFMVGADTGKDSVYSRLKIAQPGPGYCHFPAHYDEDYFAQLTSEKVITKYVRGFATRVWVKKSTHARNEALDCRVLAMVALDLLNVRIDRIASRLSQRATTQQTQPEMPPALPQAAPRRQTLPPRRSWATSWK